MSLKSRIIDWLGLTPVAPPPDKKVKNTGVKDGVAEELGPVAARVTPFHVPKIPPGVTGSATLAMDAQVAANFTWANNISNIWSEGIQFMGYPYLSELTQRAEYRRPSEILAKHMTRKWLKFQSTGDEGSTEKAEKIQQIEEEFKRLDVQNIVRKAMELDGFFGRSQIYLDLGVKLEDREEINKPISMTPEKIGKDTLARLKVIEPLWTYPQNYNSTNPLADDFYKPTTWFVMGAEVHATRLLTICSRPLPDLLKPAYAFGGLSLSQMAKPYVDNWLRTRQSVSDIIHSFTVWVLKTDMSVVLNAGGSREIRNRAKLFNNLRDNRGMFAVDKDTEDFANVSAPLGGLDALQAQSQEQMGAVTGIPLSILLGITPSGLNASSEGEIRIFYDWVEAQQETSLTPVIQYILNVVQLSKFGSIDPEITFLWNPLWSMTDKELVDIEKSKAEADNLYYEMGAIDSSEVRTRLASEEDSPYSSLDLDKIITPPGGEEDLTDEGGGIKE